MANNSYAPDGAPGARRRSRWWWIGPLASSIIFVASLVVLWLIIREIEPDDLKQAFSHTSRQQLLLAAAFAGLSYVLLTGYDALALRRLGLSIPFRTTALGSFSSYAVSFTLGFPLVTAGAVRYWVYSPRGVRTSEIASLTIIAGLTFWLGMGLVLGVALSYAAEPVAKLARTTPLVMQLVGVGVFGIVSAYLLWVSSGDRSIKVKGWRMPLPGPALTLAQMALGAVEVCSAAAVLFVLLPGGHGISYEAFLAAYVFACLIGIASHAPGGLGVFEATMLIALSQLPYQSVIGALLLFRLFYYLIPFVLALALLALYEITRRIRTRTL
jgi:glycosyltransferase 2 family protein